MTGLSQKPRTYFDKGKDIARGTAIYQAKFIVAHYPVFKQFAEKSRPKGWKVKRFCEMVKKLNNKEHLEMLEYNYMQEFYDSVSSIVLKIPDVKKEFYKGFRR